MILGSLPEEPGRVDEPEVVREYAAVFSPVVAAGSQRSCAGTARIWRP